ncbi:MAG: hypothetical protein Q7U75_08255 [Desulfobacterales bacterium]|nr:hypothetical protein [Desulfobacterales bacterium]
MTLQRHSSINAEISLTPGPTVAPARRFPAKMIGSALHRPTMIRLGSQIRLTRREVERFLKITDIEPVGIRTFDDLEAYIARCKAHYWGVSKETRFLHWLIDREAAQCRQAA